MALREPALTRTIGGIFSALAAIWDGNDRERAQTIDLTARRVIRVLRPGGNVLDIGCGTGAQLSRIRSQALRRGRRLGRTVGIDLAELMVERSNRRRGVRALRGDGLALPFADHVFDVLVGSHVLHLMGDPARAAREMFRVCTPGATLILELPGHLDREMRRAAKRLPRWSLLRSYLEMPRRFGLAAFRDALEELGCELHEITVRAPHADSSSCLARIARASGTPEDLALARELERSAPGPRAVCNVLMARLPGPRGGRMPVTVEGLSGWTPRRVERLIADLPRAPGYRLVVKPLRYRTRPHVQAFCEFDRRRIVIQVPVPFYPFHEEIPYRAHRTRPRGFEFRWYRRRLWFDRPEELVRYLYLHEYYHWYLREVMGKPSGAETACDRFALQRMRRP